MPNNAPPRCAAWSKNFHPNTTPAKSTLMITLIACKINVKVLLHNHRNIFNNTLLHIYLVYIHTITILLTTEEKVIMFTVPAANVYMGRKMMLSLVSGYCTHTYANTDIIAPD